MATSLALALGASLAALAVPTTGVAGTVATGVVDASVETASGRRPNVVLVMMDDMRADELRFLPTTRAYIRDRGLEFRNAFSPYPLCCPARASLLTGKYAHNHRVLHHDAPYGFGSFDDRLTLATQLRRSGYQTGFVGKYLNRYGIQKSKVTGRSSVHYVPAGWTDWKAGLDDGWGGRGGTYSYYDFTQNVNGRVKYNSGTYSSRVIASQAAGLVKKYHGVDRPFFLLLNPVAPHHGGPREADDPGTLTTSAGQSVKYSTPARPGWVRGRFDHVLPQALGVRTDGGPSERDMGDKPWNMRQWPEPRAAEKAAMREVERQRAESLYAWDHNFARVITALKETGELADTVFMFTSDNGYFNGEHRARQGKIKPHDPVLRVPLTVAGPGIQRGVRYSPTTTLDLTLTILEIAGAARLPGMDGNTRLPELAGPDRGWLAPVVTEGLMNLRRRVSDFPAGLATSGLRTGRYQLIMYSTGEGELYDLWNDPNQLASIYADPAYRVLRDRLVRLWKQYRSCAGVNCRTALPADLQAAPGYLDKLHGRRLAWAQAYYR